MSKDAVTEVKDHKDKPAAARPDVDLTTRSAAVVDNSRVVTDSADLAKKGLVGNLTISQAPAMSPEAVAKDAQLLNQALNKTSWGGLSSSPDVAALERILDPKNAKNTAAVEAKYAELYGTKFRDDLRTHVGNDPVNYRTVEAMLNRVDGRTNFGGNLEVALETTKLDPAKGNRLLRAAVGSLNSDQVSQMASDVQKSDGGKAPMDLVPANATQQQRRELTLGQELAASGRKPANAEEKAALNTYQKAYIDHVIGETPGITDANRKVLATMTKGVDHRTSEDIKQMANVALESKDLKMFGDAVNGDTPVAIAARKQLSADSSFTQKYNEAFTSGWTSQTTKDVAADLLSEGKVSLATIIKGDTNVLLGLLDNPKNLDLAASNATAKERQDFTAGKDLALNGRQPANDQERAALAYYTKIDQSMKETGIDGKQRSILEDEIQHGGKTLISRLAELDKPSTLGFIGGGHTTQDLLSGIENMSRADYNLLHNDKTYAADLLKSIGTYEKNEDVQRRIAPMINDKATAPNFLASQGIKRTVYEVYQDTRTGGATGENLASAIATMSPADAAMYKKDGDYRKRIDDIVQNNLSDTAKYLATSVLEQVAQTGKSPELTALQQIGKGVMDGATPLQQLPNVEKLLQDPALRARLSKPMQELTPEDRNIRMMLGQALPLSYVGMDMLMKEGRVGLGAKVGYGVPLNQLYPDMAKLPESERAQFSKLLSAPEQEILNNVVAQNGEQRLEDRVRAIVVDDGSYKDLETEFAKLTTNAQKEAVLRAYENKYHSNLSNDFMPKVDAADKIQYQNYLSPTSDGNQTYFNHVVTTDGKTSFAFDASAQTVERSVQLEKGLLAQYQALKKQLPADMQEKMNELISNAVTQNKEAPIEEIKALGKAAVDIAAVVATVFTLGAGSELLAADVAATAGEAAATTIVKGVAERAAVGIVEREAAAPVIEAAVDTTATKLTGEGVGAIVKAETGDVVAAADQAVVAPGVVLTPTTTIVEEAVNATATIAEEAAANPAVVLKATATVAQDVAAAPAAALNPTLTIANDVAVAPAAALNPTLTIADDAAAAPAAALRPTSTIADVAAAPAPVLRPAVTVAEEVAVLKPEVTQIADQVAALRPALTEIAGNPAAALKVADEAASLNPVVTQAVDDAAASPVLRPVITQIANEAAALRPAVTQIADEAVAAADRTIAADALTAERTATAALKPIAEDTAAALKPIVQDAAAIGERVVAAGATDVLAATTLTSAAVAAEVLDKPAAKTTDFTPPAVPNDKLLQLATVRRGEGPFQSAERILRTDGKKHSIDEVMALTRALQHNFAPERNDHKDMKGLKVNYQFITKDNFAAIVADVKDPHVKAQLMQFATAS